MRAQRIAIGSMLLWSCSPAAVEQPPNWARPDPSPGVIRIALARASNLRKLALERVEQNSSMDAAAALASVAGGRVSRTQIDDAVARMVVVQRTTRCLKRGSDPSVPGADLYAAYLLAEIPCEGLPPGLAAIKVARGGEVMYLK